jgi:hypothetical protein
MASVAALLRREIAIHFEKERIHDPIFLILCLKRKGLNNDLAMRVLLTELPEEISVKFIEHMESAVHKRKRCELQTLLSLLNPLLGLRAQLLPARARVARLTKPVLVTEIVKGILLGPETEADRLRELRRLQTVYEALQKTLLTTPKRRKLNAAETGPADRVEETYEAATSGETHGVIVIGSNAPRAPLPKCIWCRRVHAKRAFLKCAHACIQQCNALTTPKTSTITSRYDLVNALNDVNVA